MRQLATRTLLIATHNDGKVREFRDLMTPLGLEVVTAAERGLAEPEETGTTFEENAAIKALAAARATGMPALSDDSGLAVAALDGAPGVYTADWAQTADGMRDFAMAMQKVETMLSEIGADDAASRRASFVSVLCLAWPDGHVEYFRGEADGTLVWPPRGTAGFGYDPVFLPDGHTRTFGEMNAEEKHGWRPGDATALSHRARAFKLFAETGLAPADI
jgi:XTP/dITP diphosphohydrolase